MGSETGEISLEDRIRIATENKRKREEKERKKKEKAEQARLKKEAAEEARKVKREEAAENRKIKREAAAEARRITREEREFLRSLNSVHREIITRRRNERRDSDKAEKYYRGHSVSGLRKIDLDYYPISTEPETRYGGAMPKEVTDKSRSMLKAGKFRPRPKQEIRKEEDALEPGMRDTVMRAYNILRGREYRDVTTPKGTARERVPRREMFRRLTFDKASGAPISNKSEFSTLRDKVKMLEGGNMWIARMFGMGRNIPASIGRFGTLQTVVTGALSLASKAPYIAIIVAVATAVIKRYVAQYRPGGPRDVRKLFRAQDESMIGIPNENMLAAGETLFISNPQYLQGMPKANTNTMNLQDGISRYNLRHMGDYPW